MQLTIAMFGEAEKGALVTPYLFRDLYELVYCLGNPPHESRGLFFAVQALLYHHNLLFFRVSEEGFSTQEYLKGLEILEKDEVYPLVTAVCVPGVGDHALLNTIIPICQSHHQILLTNESDFYDYLTR